MSADPLRALVRAPLRPMTAYEVPRPPVVRAKLDANESPFPLPPEVAAELGRALADVPLHRYPRADAGGLRGLLASELGLESSWLAFGNGSDELIALLVTAFGEPRPGRDAAAVLYPTPSFVVYEIATRAAAAAPVEVPLDADLELDEPALVAALADRRPNLVFFARPNNPTGGVWSRAVIERVIRAHPDVLVVVDEAYIAYGGDSFLPLLAQHRNLILLRTLSKIGMAALRVGYLAARPELVAELEKVRPPYNVGALNLAAAELLLGRHRGLLDRQAAMVVAERERLRAALAARPGLRVYPSGANLLLFEVADAHAVWRGLADRGVLVRKFGGGRLASYLRVTIGTPEENALFLAALAEVLG
jgi:histidinol-phosphate aminotransferase